MKNHIPQPIKNIYHFAKANLAAARHGYPARNLKTIGVTGTDGKTTTSTIIYHLLKSSGKKVALISSVAAYIGDQQLDIGFHVTSPDPWPLQKLLATVKQKEIEFLVLEVTSHGLDQHRLAGVNFDTAVLTNITHEHLDYHGTHQNYLKAKSKLFKNVKTAVLNQDDESFSTLKASLSSTTNLITYPTKLSPDLSSAFKSKFPQLYNQLNAAAAALAARQHGVSNDQIIQALASFPGIPGRMQKVKNKLGLNIFIDFAHTPNALKSALKALSTNTKGRLIAVYGSAGLRDYQKRPLMGQIGAELADEVILTAEDPRTESTWSIIDQMMSSVTKNHGHIHKIPDRQQAINFALNLAHRGDTVGIFGKGHEKSMCFGKTEYPWSDKQAVKDAIKLRSQTTS